MTWVEACNDKSLQNLPYKIELNRQGKIIMSPIVIKHGYFEAQINHLLRTLLPFGEVILECAIDSSEGTYVSDAAWVSPERFKIIADEFSSSVAPEICVEVGSPSNTAEQIEMKCKLYLDKGALEFWYCDSLGQITQFDKSGELAQSKLCPQFPRQIV